jgi:transposase
VQSRALVRGDVVGLVALDLVLRIIRACPMRVAFVVEVAGVNLDGLPLT